MTNKRKNICDFCGEPATNYTFQHAAVYCDNPECMYKADIVVKRLMDEIDEARAEVDY